MVPAGQATVFTQVQRVTRDARKKMTSSAFLKPGILRGDYPERENFPDTWLDRMLGRIHGVGKHAYQYRPKSLDTAVQAIHRCRYDRYSDEELTARVPIVKQALSTQGFADAAVIEAFALIQEVASRQLGMRHFDVQLIGGWIMLHGMIAEMDTGEGKTLTATLPACTAAMAGIPVHIITVNDYLVQRDAEIMGPIYRTLGLSCGTILENMDFAARKAAYACDITYCTNKQLTFDYLKDRLVLGRKRGRLNLQLDRLNASQVSKTEKALLRGLCFAIVDEADSVLIDEARTPLILSRENQSLEQLLVYQQALDIAEKLEPNADYIIDARQHVISLSEAGKNKVEQLSKPLAGVWLARRRGRELVTQALSAQHLFIKDIHYLVNDGKVQIIDEYTGRVMADRSWERGLHQMIEIKEGCAMTDQKETIARISYQGFFRRYLHLAGMTGTAKEVRGELQSVYGVAVVRIPTNWPVCRVEMPSHYFIGAEAKWQAIVARIAEINRTGRPILIGTRSVEASEHLGRLLMQAGLPHRILNARQDADEASIVQHAGLEACITVATNMAGRGTDIKISKTVNRLGGLHVILTECHEARRIDRQLFGRCGRQGDLGSYERFLSFEDELLNKYGSRLLNKIVIACQGKRRVIFRSLAELLFRWAQMRAERHHSFIRYSLLKRDASLQQLLAFSGKSE